ncbi:MAG: hypothetical protein AB7S71_04045 [Dongiaceae bacterium]
MLLLPLDLRTQLARFGIGADDLVVIEGVPEGALLTAGESKPDGSWSLRESDIDSCAFVPLYGNGETYTLRVCVLTPDPSDHGLPKTKGKADIAVAVPLAPIPILDTFDDDLPAADNVIQLPADPTLTASAAPPAPAAAPLPAATSAPPAATRAPAATAPAPTPPPSAAVSAAARASEPAATPATVARGDVDQHFAALRAEWQDNVTRQVSAAERRLKAMHLAQLSKIQSTLAQADAQRASTIESRWKAELSRRAADAEVELKARAQDYIAGLLARRQGKDIAAGGADGEADVAERLAAARREWLAEHKAALAQAQERWRAEEESRLARAVDEARAAWDAEEAEHRAVADAVLAAAQEGHTAQIQAQQAALYEMRLAAAEAAWRKAEAERFAAAEAAWSIGEAERLAALEAKWRAEHDKRLEAVLGSLGTMVKGQLGAIAGTQPPPAVEPAAAGEGEIADGADAVGWRETAAA